MRRKSTEIVPYISYICIRPAYLIPSRSHHRSVQTGEMQARHTRPSRKKYIVARQNKKTIHAHEPSYASQAGRYKCLHASLLRSSKTKNERARENDREGGEEE